MTLGVRGQHDVDERRKRQQVDGGAKKPLHQDTSLEGTCSTRSSLLSRTTRTLDLHLREGGSSNELRLDTTSPVAPSLVP